MTGKINRILRNSCCILVTEDGTEVFCHANEMAGQPMIEGNYYEFTPKVIPGKHRMEARDVIPALKKVS